MITSHMVFHEKVPLPTDYDIIRTRPPGAFKSRHSPEQFELKEIDSDTADEGVMLHTPQLANPSSIFAAFAQDNGPEWSKGCFTETKPISDSVCIGFDQDLPFLPEGSSSK